MKKICFIFRTSFYIFLMLFPLLGFTQKEGNIWYYGNGAGIDFNSGTAVALSNGAMFTNEGCAAISDASGSLLFYTDGITVWNRNHVAMPNGSGLLGDWSSTQSGIIVRLPGSLNTYYVFTVDQEAGPNGLRYSVVDMTLQGGLGDVTSSKNIPIVNPSCEKVTAIRHQNNQDYWILTKLYNSNTFHSYLLSNAGLSMTPIISNAGSVSNTLISTIGYLKSSPNGSQIVSANWDINLVDVMDFDNGSGMISNPITLTNYSQNRPYGAEFSPNGNLLYVSEATTGTNLIYQYNLQAGNQAAIEASRITVGSSAHGGALQLGPDQKIYCAHALKDSLSTIDNPNVLGAGCNFSLFSFGLAGNTTSRFGLPTFFNAVFLPPGFSTENLCFGSSTTFLVDTTGYQFDSVLWDFGDPATGMNNSSTNLSPTHLFSVADTFDVTLISYRNNNIDTTVQQVIIAPIPIVQLGPDTMLCTGDSLVLDATNNNSTYLWQDSSINSTFTVVDGGVYWVEATLGECSTRDSIEVQFNPLPLINLGSDRTTCPDNEVILNAFGGVDYTWSTGDTTQSITIFPTGDTTISVIGIDSNGCANVDTVMITLAPAPIADAGIDQTICEGDTASLMASGGSMYLWNTGEDTSHIDVFPTDTTAYEVIVTDSSGCTDKDTVMVNVDPLPVADATYNMASAWIIEFFNNSSNEDSVSWDFGDGFSDTNENPTHEYQFSSFFNVQLIAYNDCGTDTFTFIVGTGNISIDNPLSTPEVTLYPNPVREFLNIDFREAGHKPIEIEIVSLDGKVIRQEIIDQHQSEFTQTIPLENMASGMYFLVMRGEGFLLTEKFVFWR